MYNIVYDIEYMIYNSDDIVHARVMTVSILHMILNITPHYINLYPRVYITRMYTYNDSEYISRHTISCRIVSYRTASATRANRVCGHYYY